LKIRPELRAQVAQRAGFRCEYCLIHEEDAAFAHEVDHIISRQHRADTTSENLAYACLLCNRFKGTNISSVDSTGHLVRLYNPRIDRWDDHFRLNGAAIEPLSNIGEATSRLLKLNNSKRLVERVSLQRLGRYRRT
jgi:5-methylcytosine-specific restriction endonuclease McrA